MNAIFMHVKAQSLAFDFLWRKIENGDKVGTIE